MHPRRNFLKTGAAITAGTYFTSTYLWANPPMHNRRFKMCLNPSAIGVKTNQKELLLLASKYRFEAIVGFPKELSTWEESAMKDFQHQMKVHGIVWGSSSLPFQLNKDEQTYQAGLADLPKMANAVHKAGGARMNTWVMPTDPDLPYIANFNRWAKRLKEVGAILADHDLVLGLEYIGPKTLQILHRYPFMHSMKECKSLIAEVGLPNIKIQLDSFHWFCADETLDDLLTLKNEDIVTIDLNDARSDLDRASQIDGTRELPSASGVIDLKGFLETLVQIGYDGPIRAEPFNRALNEMENEAALKATYDAMKRSFDLMQ